jgi:hypothetical protein
VSASDDNLLPRQLVTELLASSTSALSKRFQSTLLLLVELPGPESELLEPLEQLSRAVPISPDRPPVDALTTLQVPAFSNRDIVADADRTQLLAQLESRTWFILPLQKRSGIGDLHRISVGRSDGNDVVLREPSVSKYHAHFDRNEDGELAVTDDGSKNGTRVNGQPLAPGVERWVQPMDHIQFGKVPTFTCVPAVLRSVLRARQ